MRGRREAQPGSGAGWASVTSSTSAGAFYRLESARKGTARAEMPAPSRYDGA